MGSVQMRLQDQKQQLTNALSDARKTHKGCQKQIKTATRGVQSHGDQACILSKGEDSKRMQSKRAGSKLEEKICWKDARPEELSICK